MDRLKVIPLLITVVFLYTPTTIIAAGKQALLIGIQDYSQTDFSSLKGPANDLNLTKGVLRERFDFQEEEFMILKDDEATHTGIEKAFKALIERVQPGDFVYIFYSGHGSQTTDLNGDEPSGKDQTWVSYGARTSEKAHKDNYGVLDDEIGAWLAALYVKTEKVVFVSDSCHSATVSRGVSQREALIRAVEADKRPHLLGQLSYTRPSRYYGIRVGAARESESAIDFPRDDGRHYGLFTWYWAQNLQKAQAGETWHDVFKRTYTQVTVERGIVQRPYLEEGMQQPQMEGEPHQWVLGEGFTPLPPRISVVPIVEEWVEIQAGFLAGVTEGSVYRLYQPQHPNPQSLPRLTITNTEDVTQTPFVSYGRASPEGAFQSGDLVVEESHVYQFSPIKLYLEADFPDREDKALLQQLKSAFQPQRDGIRLFPAYWLTDNPSNTQWRLHLLRPKRENNAFIRASANDALPKSFSNQPSKLWVLTPEQRLLNDKLQIPFDNPSRGLELLRDHLNKLARVQELKALTSHRGSTLPVTMQTSVLRPDKSCQSGADCVRLPPPYPILGWHRKIGSYNLPDIEKHRLDKDDILTFALHNNSEEDYYCYLLNIGTDGAVHALFPVPWQRIEYARLKAGEKRNLMGKKEENRVALLLGETGDETLKVIASIHPFDVRLLEQSAFKRRGGINGNWNPLERLLNSVMQGWRQSTSVGVDEWATEQITVEVKSVVPSGDAEQ